MRDDASRARLEEMGIDVYVPRVGRGAGAFDSGETASPAAAHARARVALIARPGSASARALLAQVVRALALAGIDAAIAPDASRTDDAAGLVVFGAALAREIGAALPAGRQKSIEWVAAAEPAEIAGSVAAKRALWSELKRVVRACAKAPARPRLT